MALDFRATKKACYIGYITQAISINLAPLLYLTFERNFGLTLSQISAFIAVNFAVQLCVDLLASRFSEKMNIRVSTVTSHVLVVIGLVGLSLFPRIFPPFGGLLLSSVLLGCGGGLTEVMISPLSEACPTEGKAQSMSFLHSFYSWGQAGVVFFSSIYFRLFDINESWQYLPYLWAILPAVGGVMFAVVPIYRLPGDLAEDAGKQRKKLLHSPVFYGFILMMFCGGASEMVMSQWASGFVESALGLDKSVGDLLGPCLFALMMGTARALYGVFGGRIDMGRALRICSILCMVSYALTALAHLPWLSLAGCGLCGFSVGIFWPGILSRAAEKLPFGGISMFALLALAGDVGCLLGPSLVGTASELLGDLRWGFLLAMLFPAIALTVSLILRKKKE